MSNNDADMVDLLQDIRRWLKFSNISEARSKVTDAVENGDDEVQRDNKIIYHLSDGEHSSRDIAEYVSVSFQTVNARQSDWADLGLLEKPSGNSSYQKLVELDEVGLSAPDIPEDTGDEE